MVDVERLVESLNATMELALRLERRLDEMERRGLVDVEARAALVALQGQVTSVATDTVSLDTRMDALENPTTGVDARLDALEGWRGGTVDPTLAAHTSSLATHTHAWSAITDKPSEFTPAAHGNERHSSTFITGVSWDAVTGKPSTFTPAAHGNEAHTSAFITGLSWDQIAAKPTTFPPSMHANEAHNPDFVEVGTYGIHTHYVQVNGVWYTTAGPN